MSLSMGGEVTTLPPHVFESLLSLVQGYYKKYEKEISAQGHKVKPLHIKTNLLNLAPHREALEKYGVSISASVDLPLKLHEKYRVDKQNRSTKEKIIENLKSLSEYPYHKKISCVVTKEHLREIESFIEDIRYLHYDVGFDMQKFNVMFSFDSAENENKFDQKVEGSEMLTPKEQVLFYKKIKEAFKGDALERGMKVIGLRSLHLSFVVLPLIVVRSFFYFKKTEMSIHVQGDNRHKSTITVISLTMR